MTDANLVEIFYSAQGEGPHVGRPTLFVRLGECDLRCAWCDSPETWRPAKRCRVEVAPGEGRFRELDNPVDLAGFAPTLEALWGPPGSFVSITGGEPLLQPEAVGELVGLVREGGRRSHLETHGLAVEALERVVADIDVVSMDWKLESDVVRATRDRTLSAEPFGDVHERFLEVARRAREVYVKVVLTPNSRDDELSDLCRRIAAQSREIPLILQPVTPVRKVSESPPPERLLACLTACSEQLSDVRLIPQTHRMYGGL